MKNILVVDDNLFILDMISLYFADCMHNCNILTANNGRHALEVTGTVEIDLVMTDLDMPDMNGYDFIERVKTKKPSMPIFAMTGHCPLDVAERLRRLGVTGCIQKPFDFSDVVLKISAALAATSVDRTSSRPLAY